MNLALIALAALVTASPARKASDKARAPAPSASKPASAAAAAAPFEGHLVYKIVPRAKPVAASPGQPTGGVNGTVKLSISPRGVRSEVRFNNNGRAVAETLLATGNPPVIQMWDAQSKRFISMPPSPQAQSGRGVVKSELLGREKILGLDTVHVRISEGPKETELWTAPGLVQDSQMEQVYATGSQRSSAVASELKKLGAWGPVVRSVTAPGVVELERVERAQVDPALFSTGP